MALVRRKGHVYYYRSKRIGSRVTSEYVASDRWDSPRTSRYSTGSNGRRPGTNAYGPSWSVDAETETASRRPTIACDS